MWLNFLLQGVDDRGLIDKNLSPQKNFKEKNLTAVNRMISAIKLHDDEAIELLLEMKVKWHRRLENSYSQHQYLAILARNT